MAIFLRHMLTTVCSPPTPVYLVKMVSVLALWRSGASYSAVERISSHCRHRVSIAMDRIRVNREALPVVFQILRGSSGLLGQQMW